MKDKLQSNLLLHFNDYPNAPQEPNVLMSLKVASNGQIKLEANFQEDEVLNQNSSRENLFSSK